LPLQRQSHQKRPANQRTTGIIAGADSPSRPTAASRAMTRDRVLGRPSGSRRFPSTRSAYVAFAGLPSPDHRGGAGAGTVAACALVPTTSGDPAAVTDSLGEREHVSDICTRHGLVRRNETATG
jgi:hypothetical protein